MDNPKFFWGHLGPLSWGSKQLKYINSENTEVTLNVEEGKTHELAMRHISDTESITEISGIWLSQKPLKLYETNWLDVKPVIATIKVTVGDENNPSSFIKTFYYRDRKTAEDVWNNTKSQTADKDARILKSTDTSVIIIRKIESNVLNDADLYLDNVRYLKKVHGLHPDHNSRVEKWEITWRQ
jgi:hypothetical protein